MYVVTSFQSAPFNTVSQDIGGVAPLDRVMQLLGLYFTVFRKALIVVKSCHMKRFMQNSELFAFVCDWADLSATQTATVGAGGEQNCGDAEKGDSTEDSDEEDR